MARHRRKAAPAATDVASVQGIANVKEDRAPEHLRNDTRNTETPADPPAPAVVQAMQADAGTTTDIVSTNLATKGEVWSRDLLRYRYHDSYNLSRSGKNRPDFEVAIDAKPTLSTGTGFLQSDGNSFQVEIPPYLGPASPAPSVVLGYDSEGTLKIGLNVPFAVAGPGVFMYSIGTDGKDGMTAGVRYVIPIIASAGAHINTNGVVILEGSLLTLGGELRINVTAVPNEHTFERQMFDLYRAIDSLGHPAGFP